jgi:nucleotide-binding universal stress UspA family protein
MFKKILIPLDGSKLAVEILSRVKDLVKASDAEITLITVGHYATDEEVGEATPRVIFEAAAQENRVGRRYLEQVAAALRSEGIRARWVYMRGVPAETIIAYAEAEKMDLIAMASRKRGELAWVLGSVAERVVSHATIPVLLLRVEEPKMSTLRHRLVKAA